MAQIRTEGEREKAVAGTVAAVAGHPGRWQETCWRAGNSAYGPRFAHPRAPGERGGAGDLGQAENAAEGHGHGDGGHGRWRETPWRSRIGP